MLIKCTMELGCLSSWAYHFSLAACDLLSAWYWQFSLFPWHGHHSDPQESTSLTLALENLQVLICFGLGPLAAVLRSETRRSSEHPWAVLMAMEAKSKVQRHPHGRLIGDDSTGHERAEARNPKILVLVYRLGRNTLLCPRGVWRTLPMVFSPRTRDEPHLRMYNNVADSHDCSLMSYHLYTDSKPR